MLVRHDLTIVQAISCNQSACAHLDFPVPQDMLVLYNDAPSSTLEFLHVNYKPAIIIIGRTGHYLEPGVRSTQVRGKRQIPQVNY